MDDEGPLKRKRFSMGHVCVFGRSANDEGKGEEYGIYFLDLDLFNNGDADADGYSYVVPTFRVDGQRARTFCLLSSTLYIFEGHKYDMKYLGKSAVKLEHCGRRFPPNHKLEDEDVEVEAVKLSEMHYSKCCPCAIPTPDGKKILVFTSIFYGCEDEGDGCLFELYDLASDSWKKLPGLAPYRFYPNEPWHLDAYSFIEDHVFFIQLDTGRYALDVESPSNGWKYLGDRSVPNVWRYFPMIKNKFVFTGEWIYDVREFGLATGDPEPSVAIPQSSFPGSDRGPDSDYDSDHDHDHDHDRMRPTTITLVGHDTNNDGGVVRWCVLRAKYAPAKITGTKLYSRLLIDVYVTDVAKLSTRIDRSLKLLIDHHENLLDVELLPIV